MGHVGKLCKLAGGVMNTHSHTADCRTELFCTYAAVSGAGPEICRQLLRAGMLEAIQRHLDRRAAGAFRVGAILFSNQFGPLGQTATAKEFLQTWNIP